MPAEAEQAHLRAAARQQTSINKWNGLVLFPGITCAAISIVWGNGRSSGPGDQSLWESNLALAQLLLFAGLFLIALATVQIARRASRKGKHVRLLRAYGVPLDSLGVKIQAPEQG
ncbi:hypothetical protein [Amycolatopsis sp. cmx-11-32]|uniref:hypothetical protein n=1 Tax=Amycolatopsis sp. cmx-11-32 TaxID=2785796 RepID=UPI0039E49963